MSQLVKWLVGCEVGEMVGWLVVKMAGWLANWF